MNQILKISYKFPSFNEYNDTSRGNKYASATEKKTLTDMVAWECKAQHIKPMKSARIHFLWIEKNRRRDKDNIAFARKFIFDGLVTSGVLKNDGWDEIEGFTDDFEVGEEYGCEVVMIGEAA